MVYHPGNPYPTVKKCDWRYYEDDPVNGIQCDRTALYPPDRHGSFCEIHTSPNRFDPGESLSSVQSGPNSGKLRSQAYTGSEYLNRSCCRETVQKFKDAHPGSQRGEIGPNRQRAPLGVTWGEGPGTIPEITKVVVQAPELANTSIDGRSQSLPARHGNQAPTPYMTGIPQDRLFQQWDEGPTYSGLSPPDPRLGVATGTTTNQPQSPQHFSGHQNQSRSSPQRTGEHHRPHRSSDRIPPPVFNPPPSLNLPAAGINRMLNWRDNTSAMSPGTAGPSSSEYQSDLRPQPTGLYTLWRSEDNTGSGNSHHSSDRGHGRSSSSNANTLQSLAQRALHRGEDRTLGRKRSRGHRRKASGLQNEIPR
ncbi:hypothetical protein ACMFMF_002316 [Clarireedia jacksonii]